MNRKIENVLRIIYNLPRFTILFFVSRARVKSNNVQISGITSKFQTYEDGIIEVGKLCCIENNTIVRSTGGDIQIGDKCYINRNGNIISRGRIFIDSHVTIGPNCCIYDHNHTFGRKGNFNYNIGEIKIGKGTWIGANVTILKGATIGANCVISANCIINGIIPDNTLVRKKEELILEEIIIND